MIYLLDTNVVSELRKVRSGKADPNVAAWAEKEHSYSQFISVSLGRINGQGVSTGF